MLITLVYLTYMLITCNISIWFTNCVSALPAISMMSIGFYEFQNAAKLSAEHIELLFSAQAVSLILHCGVINFALRCH